MHMTSQPVHLLQLTDFELKLVSKSMAIALGFSGIEPLRREEQQQLQELNESILRRQRDAAEQMWKRAEKKFFGLDRFTTEEVQP